MERMKKNRYSAASVKALCRRGTALLLDACMVLSMFGGLGLFAPAAHAEQTGSGSGNASRAGGNGATSGVTRQADPSTMDTYKQMLDFSQNTRYAGRIWSDKTVFALGDDTNDQDSNWNGSALTLTEADDGVIGSIGLDEDFLHVYSVLGSSQEIVGVPPVRTVIVFDNSGSMYGNSATWSDTRIAKTVDAINAAIDTLMLTSEYNEVSVVLFGDGANGGENADEAGNTMRYHGNNTAVTILPMKHYTPSEQAEQEYNNNAGSIINNTQYLKAGWLKGSAVPVGDRPAQSADQKGESGCVFVNNTVCKLKKGDTTAESDNTGHTWFDENESSWTGWNGCGDHDYTCYANGTTNIQAGMYQGMQELLNANKTEMVGTREYQCVPSLVVLTDGAVTDALDNWMEPTTKTVGAANVPGKELGFVNDFGYKGTSFVEHNDSRGDHKDAAHTSWNQFLAVKNSKNNADDPKQPLSDEAALVQKGDYYYEAVASADAADKKIHYESYKYDKHPDAKDADTTKAKGASLTAMQALAHQYRDNEAYMIFSYLLTSAYYKQAVKEAYNVNSSGNWDIFTITVDMPDPSSPDGFAPGLNGNDAKAAPVTTNPAMMDPGNYFKTEWLKGSKYLNTDVEEEDNTFYDDYTVGDMTVEGIRKAIQAWNDWNDGKEAEELGLNTFRSFQSGTDLNANGTKGKIKVYMGDGTDPVDQDTYNTFDNGFPSPSHSSFFRVYAPQTMAKENGDYYIPTKAEALAAAAEDGFQFDKLNPAYVTKAFYANAAGGSGKDIANAFVEIMDAITDPLFTPVGGMNDLGVSDAVTYMDPVGKYMDVKDVKNLSLFGTLYNLTRTAVYDYQWNHQYMANKSKPSDPMTEGWYLGTPEDDKYGGNGAKPSGYDGNDPWADGWVYRVNFKTAANFVPTLASINSPDKALDKERNTVYTFYRIADDDTARKKLHLNPAYLEKGQTTDDEESIIADKGVEYDAGGSHLKTPGVYALSDLRIWVEDSGDFNDKDVESGGVMSDANFDEALWINIPVNMLPMRIVTVNLGKTGGSDAEWTYTTNQDDPNNNAYLASFPLRVFYTVGISDEVLQNGRINMAGSIKAEYILQNKIDDAVGHKARSIPTSAGDVVEFFSNWYNPLKRYGAYAITGTDYTYGDPVTSFSPSSDNRYYVFEKALPLYKAAYRFDGTAWKAVNVTDTGTANFGGRLLATLEEDQATDADGIQSALEIAPKAGDMVLLESDVLDDVNKETPGGDPFPSEKYYFLPIEYYELDKDGMATWTQYVIARKGSEFGSAYEAAHITNGDMLCWHDRNGKYPDYPYLSFTETDSSEANDNKGDASRGKDFLGWPLDANGYYKECSKTVHEYPKEAKYTAARGNAAEYDESWKTQHQTALDEGDWVVCAKPGGLRVGDLAQNVKAKGGDPDTDAAIGEYYADRYAGSPEIEGKTWAFYANNITRTANNYYVPTISNASDLEHEAAGVKVNVYLGNNGRLYVSDTTLLVTKAFEPPEGVDPGSSNVKFNYQLYLKDITGSEDTIKLDAIVVRWNGTAKSWQRQYHTIDLELDSQRFLQTLDGVKAIVDKEGSRLIRNPNPDPGDGTYTEYVYAGNNAPYNEQDGPYYVYIAPNQSATANVPEGCFRVYHNEQVDDNEAVNKQDVIASGTSGGEGTFSAAKVYLVSFGTYAEKYADKAGAVDGTAEENHDTTVEGFELLKLDPNVNTENTEIFIDTPYLTASSYWTKTVEFGVNSNAEDGSGIPGKPLTEGDLYDKVIPTADYPDLTDGNILKNTAEFTLGAGEALLFTGLPGSTVYRVTEKLTGAQLEEGYTLKELRHNQQQGSVSTYRPGIQSLPVYYDENTTYGSYYGRYYGEFEYPDQYRSYKTENGLTWSVDQNNTPNDAAYLHYEPFHHTNAILWEYYVTMDKTAQGDNHHQPQDVTDGEAPFWVWDAAKKTSERYTTGEGTTIPNYKLADNPSCKSIEQGGCDEYLEGNQVRHYMFKDGEMLDKHYQGEGSGYIRNIARYLVTPTVHFAVNNEESQDTPMPKYKPNADYTGVYSAFGNTGTFEESANFVNTIQKDKVETKINGENTEPVDNKNDPNTYPGVQAGNTITYQIKWANAAEKAAHVVIIDQLDEGVDFVRASDDGVIYNDKDAANAALKAIYKNAANTPELDRGHVVIWDLGMQDGGANGAVTLTVQVNKKAATWWDYDGDGVADAPAEPYPDDYRVRDRATVRVADNTYFTNTVENPVGEPDKTETKVDRGPAAPGTGYKDETVTEDGDDPNLKPGEDGKWHGPLVFVGDTITYDITWRNYENKEATISIRDPLDAHVSFVSASYDPTTFVAGNGTPLKDLTDPPVLVPGTPQTLNAGDPDNRTDDEASGYGPQGTGSLPAIQYDPPTAHTVTWNLGKMPAGASGKVTLVVKVEQSAAAVGVVDNTAYVQVGNEPEQKTRTMENPVPEEEKEELGPGDGVIVGIGDTITYAIHWQNYQAETAHVIIMDTLDPGVDYVSNEGGGTYYQQESTLPKLSDDGEDITIPAHTVVWVLRNQEPSAKGTVKLTVRVNKDAKVEHTYKETADGFTGDPDGKDLEVFNQARVKVGNDSFLKTDIVENPVPEKTETKVNEESAGLAPKDGADGTYTGPRVFVGDKITYEISWKNGHDTAADVVIVDELDPGVDFVSADNGGTYDAADHTVTWNLGVKPAGDSGKVTLTVQVNEKATQAGTVDNQASVRVNGDKFVKTEIIENPTPKVEKTEVSPGEGMQVAPGDEIEYKIDWRNYEEEPADVVIIDKLDPGVDFVSATADGVTLEADDGPASQPTEANLTIRLEGGEGVEADTDFTFTLELTAPDGGPALAAEYAWQKTAADGSATQGTWKAETEENTLTLKAGESLTLQDLPVGTKYTLTPKDGGDAVVTDAPLLGLYGSMVTVKAATVQQPAALMDTAPVAGGPEMMDSPQPSGPEAAGDPVNAPVDDPVNDPVDAPTGDLTDDSAGDPANIRQKSPPAIPEETGSQPAADGPAVDSTPDPESTPNLESSPDPESSPAPSGTETTPPAEGSQDEGSPGSGGTETTPPAEGSQDESSTGGTETPPPDGELNPQPADDPDTGLPGTGAQGGSAQDTAGNTDGPAVGEPRPEGDGLAPNGPETAVTYVFTAQIEDLPAPGAAANDLPMPMAIGGFGGTEFDPETGKLGNEEPSAMISKNVDGQYIYIYYYKEAHTVVWVLKQRPAGAEGSVSLKVRVNGKADNLWSYDHPTEGPSDTELDYRVRNQAGVSVGNDALVKTRIIENPTKPQKTETNINDTDVSRDLVADADGYVGPQVHVGDTITYRITWQNNAVGTDGRSARAWIVITDTLDDHVDFVDASSPGRYDAATHTVIWDLGIAEPGARGFVTLRVRVNATAEDKVENQATVRVGNESTKTDVIENPVEKLSSLVVKKIVKGNAGSKAALWHFHVVVDKPITGLYGEMNFTNGVADFTLTDGQECRATDLPAGITYTVTEEEADLDGYETTQSSKSDGESGTIPAGEEKRAEFINSKNIDEPEPGKGHLIVTKTVMGSAGDVNRVWHFRVELSDPGINGPYGEMTFDGGVAEFTLKHGQSAAALNLPAGITYTVTEVEADQDGYATTKNGAAGTIPKGGTARAGFINRKDPTPPPGPEPTPTPSPSPTPTPEDETTPTPTPPPSVRIPQTGDDSPLLLWVVLLAVSALGLCVTVFVHWSRKGRRAARQRKKQ